MNKEIKEILDCYDLKELKKLKKKYGTVKVSMNYNIDKISPLNWEDVDYAIFYQTLVLTIYKKEHKHHSFVGKTIVILPDWYDGILEHIAKILDEEAGIKYENNAMKLIWWELKFNYKLKTMKQIKVYT